MSAWRPSLLLFDLDGVLVDYDREVRVRHLARATGAEPERVWQALFESGLEARFDAGTVETGAYLTELGQALGGVVDIAAWTAARAASMRLDAATVALLQHLAQRHDVALLTNNGCLLIEQLNVLIPPLAPLFRGRALCSASLGRRKPDAEAYLRAVRELGHEPASTLFLDDVPANVEGARRAGLRAEHVPSPARLAAALASHVDLPPQAPTTA